jgi:hypothetical protein
MKVFAALLVALFASPAFASYDAATDTQCYLLSREWGAWEKATETLCVQGRHAEGLTQVTGQLAHRPLVTLSLSSRALSQEEAQTVAVFHMTLLQTAGCRDCNMDVYGLLSPTDTSVSYLQVSFTGSVNYTTRVEAGTVEFGPTKFYYRDL